MTQNNTFAQKDAPLPSPRLHQLANLSASDSLPNGASTDAPCPSLPCAAGQALNILMVSEMARRLRGFLDVYGHVPVIHMRTNLTETVTRPLSEVEMGRAPSGDWGWGAGPNATRWFAGRCAVPAPGQTWDDRGECSRNCGDAYARLGGASPSGFYVRVTGSGRALVLVASVDVENVKETKLVDGCVT